MKIIEILDVPIYNTDICCLIGGTIEDFEILYEDNKCKFTKEEYDSIKEDLENKNYAGFVTCISDNSYFLYINENYINQYDIVIHEIFHLTNHILWDRNIDLDKSGEAYAYLIGYLSKQYFNIIDNYKELEIKNNEE